MMRDSSPPEAMLASGLALLAPVGAQHQLDPIGAVRARAVRGSIATLRLAAPMPSSASAPPTSRTSRSAASRRACGERRGCEPAPRARPRPAASRAARSADSAAPSSSVQLGARAPRVARQHVGERAAVLALEPADQREPLVDLGQPLGIALEPVGVVRAAARGVLDQDARLGHARGPGRRAPRRCARSRSSSRSGRVEPLDRGRRRRRRAAPRRRARRARSFSTEASLPRSRPSCSSSPVAQSGAVELLELEAQVVGPLARGRSAPACAVSRSIVGARSRAALCHAASDRGRRAADRPANASRISAWRRGIDQALVLVLARQIDQQRAELGQPARGGQRAVDVGAAAAAALDHAADQAPRRRRRPPRRRAARPRQSRARPARADPPGTSNDRLDHRLVGAGARDVGAGAAAAQQVDRLDDERLAGAGLAGEHVEPGRRARARRRTGWRSW